MVMLMAKKLRIALAQLNLTVGDIEGNLEKHFQAAIKARDELGADLIVFSELSLTGYPPEDLLFRKEFIHRVEVAMQRLIQDLTGIHYLIGYPQQTSQGLFNACALISNGTILGRYAKQHLPNYGVFDEDRYFTPSDAPSVIMINEIPVGLVICEDTWFSGPVHQAVARGARLILSPNASPFETNKHEQRLEVLSKRAKQDQVPIVYVNQVGGQDELIFDGGSMLIDPQGNIATLAGFFQESITTVDIEFSNTQTHITSIPYQLPSNEEKIYSALVLALRDYINKNQISGVLLGVSGGIDSALTLAIAVDALGKDRVHSVYMPSRYSADISLEDAQLVAKNLGVSFETLSIEPAFKAFLTTLEPCLKDKKPDVTEENIQARCRAILLMALSNKTGNLVLTTGNHSEVAVGYCTLYGDMAGGFDVLKDVPKTLVYELAHYRNTISHVIPERTIFRAPSAELAPNQKDEDSLPPYTTLDPILHAYINENKTPEEIVALGFEQATVERIIRLIRLSEYKRRQSAIGPRINHKSFGRDWRYPVTNGFKIGNFNQR